MNKPYDAIVIGARCAGASTAMLLARQGYRVLLLDRATFPSDIPHGHYVHRNGPAHLAKWGLLEQIEAAGCPGATSVTRDNGDFPLVGRDLYADGLPLGYGPRRSLLDKILVDAALEAGAELRENCVFDDVLAGGDRVVGVRAHTRGYETFTESATITIGADGRRSRLAGIVGAAEYAATPPLLYWYFSYWSDVPIDGLEIYMRDQLVIIAHMTSRNQCLIACGSPSDQLTAVRSNLELAFDTALDQVPALAERVRNGHREERYYGAADLPNFYRVPQGNGWALVGDAGCHKDPFMALGICDAFRDAELLVNAIDDGLNGRREMGSALATYQQMRDQASLGDYKLNLKLARFEPMPEVLRVRAAIRGDQEEINRLFLALADVTPRKEYFSRENMERILGKDRGSGIEDRGSVARTE